MKFSRKHLKALFRNPAGKEALLEYLDGWEEYVHLINIIKNECDVDKLSDDDFLTCAANAGYALKDIADDVCNYQAQYDFLPSPIVINGIDGLFGVYFEGEGAEEFFDEFHQALKYADEAYKGYEESN